MAEFLYGLSDMGGTRQRVEVWNDDMELVGAVNGNVDPNDYDNSVLSVADNMRQIADRSGGELVAVTVAVASELDDEGRMVLGGALQWNGKRIGPDVGEAAGVSRDQSDSLNDMRAVAESQLAISAARGVYEVGYVTTLSSGWGGKPYGPTDERGKNGWVGYDSPGHVHLRDGAQCPCGGQGHAEAFVSGNGSLHNTGVRLEERLTDRDAANQFVTDLSTATIALIERNSKAMNAPLEVVRWMGGVAAGQPVLMARAEEKVREEMGPSAPAWEAVTLGAKAGLHGAFIHARRLAHAA